MIFLLIFATFSLMGCNSSSPHYPNQPQTQIQQVIPKQSQPIIQSGTFENPLLDSHITWEQELKNMSAQNFPQNIINKQQLVNVKYYANDGKIHQGQLVIDKRLVNDIQKVFEIMLQEKFSIHSVIPISQFEWSDDQSMNENNTSAFNYRKVKGKNSLSNHAVGQAIDINPFQNPYISGKHISPKGARYDYTQAGTLTKDSPIVEMFLQLGWKWGGRWKSIKDFQHFEKKLD